MVVIIKSMDDLKKRLTDAGDALVVIDFFATWCGPCKAIAPYFEELTATHSDVVFLKVDVDECADIASEYEISSMPTFIFIKRSEKIESFSGSNVSKLTETILRLK